MNSKTLKFNKIKAQCRFFSSSQPKNSLEKVRKIYADQLNKIKEDGTYKYERVITTPQSNKISVQSSQKKVLNFCANNYLGLANNQELIDHSKEILNTHGLGLASVRFICGTQDIHKQLERKISNFHQKEDAILYGSCFDANAGIFEAILNEEDAILSDELNHASIIDGIRLSKANKQRYKHLDMDDLEEKLRSMEGKRIKLIVTDGVFSMDGDIAPLDKICKLADKYEAMVMTDECHASGFMGKTGRGIPEYFGVMQRVDIVNSTIGKALGGTSGGYTAAAQEIIDLLRQKSRPYLFSNSLAPVIVGSAIQVFDLLSRDTSLRDKLERNTKRFRQSMKKLGFMISGDDNHPIAPVMIPDAKIAGMVANDLLSEGIYVIAFSYPVVPKGKSRIRVQLSSSHSDEDIDKTIQAFAVVGRKYNIIN